MTLAYRRMPEPESSGDGAEMGGRLLTSTQLFDVYAERMARYRSKDMRFAPSDTIAWLTWLAKQLTREGKPTFFLEDMQPSWLAADDRPRLARSMRLLVFLMLVAAAQPGGGMVGSLINELGLSLPARPEGGLAFGWGLRAVVAVLPLWLAARLASPWLLLVLVGLLALVVMALRSGVRCV